MKLPKISVIMPSLNQGRYLETALLSVISQKYQEKELIILDGGSDDGSVEIIKKYTRDIYYWHSKPDAGQAHAINQGFDISTGDILCWLNSDDYYEPEAFIQVGQHFTNFSSIQFLYGEGWYADEENQRISPCSFVRPQFDHRYISNKDPILQQAAFWRRDLWETVGELNTSLNWVFDWDWFIRANQVTKFSYLPAFLANYRVHSQAKSRAKVIDRYRELAWITNTYGRPWYPNALVQGARIFTLNVHKLTAGWPSLAQRIFRTAAYRYQQVLELIFYKMYST